MKTREVTVGGLKLGGDNPFFLIAGPCVIESHKDCLDAARQIKEIAAEAQVPVIFKSSFDKANRSSVESFRGVGLQDGLKILAAVKKETGMPILTDVHESAQCDPVAEVADILQVPAFLCRQTDLLIAAGKTGRAVNVKKGQFLAPGDMRNVIEKIRATDNEDILLTERGTSFGYHYLVNDMRALPAMRKLGYPVIYDGTHSVQTPGGMGSKSGGERQYIPMLTRAAVAAGVDGIFLEVHQEPDRALSDGPNMLPIRTLLPLLQLLRALHEAVKETVTKEEFDPPRIAPGQWGTFFGNRNEPRPQAPL